MRVLLLPCRLPVFPSSGGESFVPLPAPSTSSREPSRPTEEDIAQPEQELTPQVSEVPEEVTPVPEVERDATPVLSNAAPSNMPNMRSNSNPEPHNPADVPASSFPDSANIPVPDSDEGLLAEAEIASKCLEGIHAESVLLATEGYDEELSTFTTLSPGINDCNPPLAEDNLPYVVHPLECTEHQAFCLEIPLKAKDFKRWSREKPAEQLSFLATVGKRARAEVHTKDLTDIRTSAFRASQTERDPMLDSDVCD